MVVQIIGVRFDFDELSRVVKGAEQFIYARKYGNSDSRRGTEREMETVTVSDQWGTGVVWYGMV